MTAPKPTRSRSFELMRVLVAAQRKAGDDWIRAREISFEQGFALGYLVENPGAIQRDIARASHRGEASVSSLLQGLETRGLVERRTEDGDDRSKRVYATPAGADIVTGLGAAMAAIDEVILAPADPAERAALEAVLTKIVAELPELVPPKTKQPARP